MNRPPKGDTYRRGNSASMMFRPSAQDTPNMSIKVAEGTFWLNGTTLVEYGGGSSPLISAPSSGARWVLVVINKLGTLLIANGEPKANNPTLPEISRNLMPIAAIYIKSSTKIITNDMIYDVRPTLAAGGQAQQHNQLADRNIANAHPISAITNLQETLDNKISKNELDDILYNKANATGTHAATFVLNEDDTGVPVEYCGVTVNRGSQPNVGIRFNEDTDTWQYTNDGSIWTDFGKVVDTTALANSFTIGRVKLTADPIDPEYPIAVSASDPVYISISEKADRTDLLNYVEKSDLQDKLDLKADAENVYTKADAEKIFITRAENATSGGAVTLSELTPMLELKANKASTYTKDEVNNLLSKYYDKDSIDALLKTISPTSIDGTTLLDYYKKSEIDDLIANIEDTTYTKSDIETKLADKANISDVYTKTEIDNMVSKLPTNSDSSTDSGSNTETGTNTDTSAITDIDLSNVYTKVQIDAFLEGKADKSHYHSPHDISNDECHQFVSYENIKYWNNKLDKFDYTPENNANKGVANGYASLDASGKVPTSQLPAAVLNNSLVSSAIVVDTFADLAAIESPVTGTHVYVKDASNDSSVDSGWAEYIVDKTGNFVKISEQESIDMILDWSNITNKPSVFEADPNSSALKDYATITDVSLLSSKLNDKSDIGHNHDDNYYTKTYIDTVLKDYAKSSDLHAANVLGTTTVDETDKAANTFLMYDGNKLVYTTLSSIPSGENNPVTVDYYQLGTLKIDETDKATGKSIIYDGEKLVYGNCLDSYEIDSTNIDTNKYLAFNGTKFEYKSLPTNLLDIDNSSAGEGKVLAYTVADGTAKLVYKDMPTSTGTSASGDTYYTFTPTGATVDTDLGPVCQVTATSKDVTFTKSGLDVAITPKDTNTRLISAVVKFSEDELSASSNTVTINYNSLLENDYANMYVPQIMIIRGIPGGGSMAYYSAAKFNFNTNAHTVTINALPSDAFTIRLTY